MPAITPSRQHGRVDLPALRKRAKHLLKALRLGQAEPERAQLLSLGRPGPAYQLADSQWLVAREAGFSSWPKLKAHADALDFAARHPGFAHADEAQVQHWRCGNDIEHSLRTAGLRGAFHMLVDPLAMGPVPALEAPAYHRVRCAYIQQAFGLGEAAVQQRQAQEYAALARIDGDSEVVLWCEADAYDQLFLVRLLAGLPALPKRLELIETARVPGVERFIGIGQLAPDVLAWLWPQRRPLGEGALALAREVWAAYTAADPGRWAQLARVQHLPLPLLGPALARQLQELPGVQDGLGLTERLTLRVLAQRGECPAGKVFGQLMLRDDPLPYLGDLMFHALIRPLIDGPQPLLIEGQAEYWGQRPLQLTRLGEQVLAGQAYWLDHQAPLRWVGGVRLASGEGHWAVEADGTLHWR
ncbi:DUF1835 domain-containing protein [Pseudomonas sp. NPDC007930]|uniref:DUF1835 domain-containing protein n=1 Tax=Pseudomonas sp. NPDC007930 TaxID=3364417 RepID=UPI0036E33087